MTERGVLVTGIGFVTPAGSDIDEVWKRVLDGQCSASGIDRFDTSPFACRWAGTVGDEALDGFPRRLLKRMDRFCQLALAAARNALSDSGLVLEEVDRERVGVFFGNMFGGWEIADPSLRRLLGGHPHEVNPYVASAWFPAAPQGQITIHYTLRGYSKTFAADTASGALALGHAADAILDGQADVIFAGGAEAPLTPYTYAFCDRSGRLDSDGYRPFDRRGAGFQVGEGAVVLVLEEEGHARSRGARAYARLAGWATGRQVSSGARSAAEAQAATIERALAAAGRCAQDVDYVALDAQGTAAADEAEAEAVAQALDGFSARPVCTTTKPAITHLLGGAPVSEAATTVLAIARGHAPPIAGSIEPARARGLRLAMTASSGRFATAVVNSRGGDGVHAALIFTDDHGQEGNDR